jgi:hypothetical protein
MPGPHGSWNDKHHLYQPPWGSTDAYGDSYDHQYGTGNAYDGGTDGNGNAHDGRAYGNGNAYDRGAYDRSGYDGNGNAYNPNAYNPNAYDPNTYDPNTYTDDRYTDDGYQDQNYGDDSYGADAYGDASYHDHPPDQVGRPDHAPPEHERAGVGDSLRGAVGALSWRYRSAPLWVRVSLDVGAAVLVLVLLVGGALALRGQGGPDRADGAATSGPGDGAGGTVPPLSTVPVATSTTTTTPPTTPPTTTARATTPTTVAPTTTAATTPPTTSRRGPPTTTTPTSTSTTPPQEVHYRNCLEALRAGALPLFEGDPGYSRRLDDDGDGQACEIGEGWSP